MANFYQNVYKFCHQGELTCFKIVTTIKKLFNIICSILSSEHLFVYIFSCLFTFCPIICPNHAAPPGDIFVYFFQNLMFNFLLVNLLVIVALFEWRPNPDEFYVVFVLAGLWGVSDAIWQTQINGKHKAAYKTIHFLLSLEKR